MEQKDLLIVVQDCKTYFWRGTFFSLQVLWGCKKKREKGGELKEICCQFVLKMKICFSLWCFSREITSVDAEAEQPSLYIVLPWFFDREIEMLLSSLFCFLPSQEKAFNRVIFTKKPSKLGLKMGTLLVFDTSVTLLLDFFLIDSKKYIDPWISFLWKMVNKLHVMLLHKRDDLRGCH